MKKTLVIATVIGGLAFTAWAQSFESIVCRDFESGHIRIRWTPYSSMQQGFGVLELGLPNNVGLQAELNCGLE